MDHDHSQSIRAFDPQRKVCNRNLNIHIVEILVTIVDPQRNRDDHQRTVAAAHLAQKKILGNKSTDMSDLVNWNLCLP